MKYTAAVPASLMRCANTAGRCWPACQCVSAATAKSTEMAMEPSVFSRSTFASWKRPAHVIKHDASHQCSQQLEHVERSLSVRYTPSLHY